MPRGGGSVPKTVSVSRLRNNLPEYLEDLPDSETLMVLRHNEPVAFMLSPDRYKEIIESIEDVSEMLQAIKDFRENKTKFADADNFFKEIGI